MLRFVLGLRIILIILLGACGLITAGEAGEIDVYLLSGQSNMQGCGLVADLKEDIPKVIPNAFFVRGKTIEPLTLGKTTGKKVPSLGPEIGFALEMATRERPVYLIKYAASGIALHAGWSGSKWRGTEVKARGSNFYPGVDAQDDNRGGHYKGMLNLYQRSLRFLKTRNHTPVIRGFIWMQGEQDAKREESASVYATSLRNLRARLCEDLGLEARKLPMAFGQIVPNGPVPARFAALKTMHAQMEAADQDSGKPEAIENCKMVSTVGFTMKPDMVHFDGPGQIALGRALGKALDEIVTNERSRPKKRK